MAGELAATKDALAASEATAVHLRGIIGNLAHGGEFAAWFQSRDHDGYSFAADREYQEAVDAYAEHIASPTAHPAFDALVSERDTAIAEAREAKAALAEAQREIERLRELCIRAEQHGPIRPDYDATVAQLAEAHKVMARQAQRGNVKERFGERIRRVRTEQKLGLREFATKVGISPTYLSRIETSEEKAPPAEDVIRKMAAQLSDSFDELMTLAGRVSEESLNVIKADSGMPEFLRTVGERKLSAEDLMKLLPNEPKKGKR